MGFPMGQVASNAVPLKLTFKGSANVLSVTFRPMYYTATTEAKLDKIEREQGVAKRIYANLCMGLESWDAVDEHNKPIPLTIEGLTAAEMPTRVCNEILNKCATEISVGELSAVSS